MRASVFLVWMSACGDDAGTDAPPPPTTTTPAPTDTPRETGTPTEPAPTFAPSAVWDSFANDWEPFTAADPGSSWVYQVTTRFQPPRSFIVFRASDDGGETWGPDQFLGEEPSLYDPFVAVASETGCVFAGWLFPFGTWKTYVSSSCDHGETWSTPVNVSDWSSDHGWLIVSADGQDVYVGFNGTAPGNPEDMWQAAVVASHDGGATFGEETVFGDGGPLYWFQTGGAVAPDGTVYFAAMEYSHDYTGPSNVAVWRSIDGGATFDISVVDVVQEPPPCAWAPGCEYGFLAAQAAVAVGVDGSLLVLSQASSEPQGHQAMVARSSPGGDAWDQWSAPVVLGDGTVDNAFPTAVAGPAPGDFRVAWQANAADPTDWNTWYQRTADGGTTWLDGNVRLSDPAASAPYRDEEGYRFPYGDYIAISVDDAGLDHVIWGEGGSYNGPGGTWYTRALP